MRLDISSLVAAFCVNVVVVSSASVCEIQSPSNGQSFRCQDNIPLNWSLPDGQVLLARHRIVLEDTNSGLLVGQPIPITDAQGAVLIDSLGCAQASWAESERSDLQFQMQGRGADHADWTTLCSSAAFVVSETAPTPAPTPGSSSSSPPLWVWPLAGIGCIALLVFCFGMFNNARRSRGLRWSGGVNEPILSNENERNFFSRHRGHHVLLDPADAHPLQPPARDSLANEYAQGSPRTGRWSTFSHGFPTTRASLTMAERQDSFMRRAENRQSFLLKGAVRWVRAMNARSGVVQWIRVDQLNPEPSPRKTASGGISWVQRRDQKGVVWMVRSDDVVLAEEFSQIDWQSIAAHGFELKARWFRHELEQRLLPPQAEGGPVKFTVQRGCEVDMMQAYFNSMKPADFHRTFRFRFDGETDFFHDAGGVAREVYNVLVDQLFAEEQGLFEFSDIDNLTYSIKPSHQEAPEHKLQLLRMAGLVLGKALLDGVTLNVHLSAVLYKHLLRVPLTTMDVMLVDSQVHSSLCYMLDNAIEGVFFESFSVGGHPLCEGGAEIEVNDANKAEYAALYAHWLLIGRVKEELFAFCSAFWSIVPEALLSVLDFQELELLMCGLPQLDLEDWKAHTRYGTPLSAKHQVVGWFWEIVAGLDSDERAKLLQFSTGTSNVPVAGFKGLQSTRGKQCLFKLSAVDPKLYSLPRAHTCFNTIDLPLYGSKEELAKNLQLVIDMEAIGFGLDE